MQASSGSQTDLFKVSGGFRCSLVIDGLSENVSETVCLMIPVANKNVLTLLYVCWFNNVGMFSTPCKTMLDEDLLLDECQSGVK